MATTTTRRVIGTRTGKTRHLMVESLASVATGYTTCGRYIKNAVEQDSTVNANCQKCIDKADLAEGGPAHRLSITDLRDDDGQWIGDTATCSCSGWGIEVLNGSDARKTGGVGPTIVTHHYAHVIATVRAARTTPKED